jgi:beta-lactamase class C
LKQRLRDALRIDRAARANAWLDDTGSTNDFPACVAVIAAKQLASVMLSNRNYPIEDRVTARSEFLPGLLRGQMTVSKRQA